MGGGASNNAEPDGAEPHLEPQPEPQPHHHRQEGVESECYSGEYSSGTEDQDHTSEAGDGSTTAVTFEEDGALGIELREVADTNNDGVTNWKEFKQWYSETHEAKPAKAVLLLFRQFDADGDGQLDAQEFRALRRHLGASVREKEEGTIVVTSIVPDTQASRHKARKAGTLHPGLMLVGLGKLDVRGLGLDDVQSRMAAHTHRPLTLHFREQGLPLRDDMSVEDLEEALNKPPTPLITTTESSSSSGGGGAVHLSEYSEFSESSDEEDQEDEAELARSLAAEVERLEAALCFILLKQGRLPELVPTHIICTASIVLTSC